MTRNPTHVLRSAPTATLAALALFLLSVPAGAQQDKIASAMSAAPASISENATIMDWPATAGGQSQQLRAGTNGWVCYPSTPTAVSATLEDPMCLDKTFQAWAQAWMTKTRPTVNQVGIAYMLRGDAGVSNTDPFATRQSANNHWVRTGPHIMVLEPDLAKLNALPTEPNNGGPWVMWKGTPYEHVMVPVGPMPMPMNMPMPATAPTQSPTH